MNTFRESTPKSPSMNWKKAGEGFLEPTFSKQNTRSKRTSRPTRSSARLIAPSFESAALVARQTRASRLISVRASPIPGIASVRGHDAIGPEYSGKTRITVSPQSNRTHCCCRKPGSQPYSWSETRCLFSKTTPSASSKTSCNLSNPDSALVLIWPLELITRCQGISWPSGNALSA